MSFENVIENEAMEITTEATATISEEDIAKRVISALTDKAYGILCDYGYPVQKWAVREIIEKAWLAKAEIRKVLRRHPKWDEDQQAIIFSSEVSARINPEGVLQFQKWIHDMIYAEKKKNVIRKTESGMSATYDTLLKWKDELGEELYGIGGGQYVRKSVYEKLDAIDIFFYYENDNFESTLASAEFVKDTEKIAEVLGDPKLVATEGQKVSRVVNKICKAIGFDVIKDVRQIVRHGETVDKDFGFNYQFSAFADAINPVHITKYTVFSINPIDYWKMSIGTTWSSCHGIDMDNDYGFRGEWSSGTESYMLDESSVVFYTVDENYVGDMADAGKDRRMMFHLAPDMKSFIQGRLYPDGRDGGETGLAAQFRNIVQKIIADCLDVPNLWSKFEKECASRYATSLGTHYRDYTHYSDTGISHLLETEMARIVIGHRPICPNCGKEHDRESNICCDRCNGDYDEECYECGEGINTDHDNYWYCDDDGRYFCCESCYERAGYVKDYDGYIHKKENCCYDAWEEEWVYADWEDGVSPDGESWYRDSDNANSDGWIELETPNGHWEWYREDDCEEDHYTGKTICTEWDEVFSPDGYHWYLNAKNAVLDGWRPTFDDIVRLAENGDIEEWEKN